MDEMHVRQDSVWPSCHLIISIYGLKFVTPFRRDGQWTLSLPLLCHVSPQILGVMFVEISLVDKYNWTSW
jgi:hypothetical protein